MPTLSLLDEATDRHENAGTVFTSMLDRAETAATVLVADDDDDVRDLIAFKLQMAGYRVLTADTGTAALSLIETQLPDAVILDVGMPGLDGFGVCYRLQALRATVDIPVIILSARDSSEDISLGYTVGADEYLTKPFHPGELVRRVRWLLLANGG